MESNNAGIIYSKPSPDLVRKAIPQTKRFLQQTYLSSKISDCSVFYLDGLTLQRDNALLWTSVTIKATSISQCVSQLCLVRLWKSDQWMNKIYICANRERNYTNSSYMYPKVSTVFKSYSAIYIKSLENPHMWKSSHMVLSQQAVTCRVSAR